MSKPEYRDVTRDSAELHNTSPQYQVERNTDPSLDMSKEHRHAHLHHNASATAGRDHVEYSIGTTFESSTMPPQDPQDHALHRRHHPEEEDRIKAGAVNITNAEKGTLSPAVSEEEDPQTHTLARFYGKFKIGFHVFAWLLFTGCVAIHLVPLACNRSSQALSLIIRFSQVKIDQ